MLKSLFPLALLLELIWFLFVFLDKKSVIQHSLALGDIGNIVVLTITAWMVWIYTVEAQKSNEIQEKPILNLYLKENKHDNRFSILKIKNVGKGPAYNIVVSPIKVNGFSYLFSFNEPNFILGFDQGRELSINVLTPNNGVEVYESTNSHTFELFTDRLFLGDINSTGYDSTKMETTIFLINFEGLDSKKYYSIFRLYPKFWPLSRVYDLVLEYVKDGSGVCNMETAKKIAQKKSLALI